MQTEIVVDTPGRGLHGITDLVRGAVSLPEMGLLNVFILHTSASLLIQENADPSARRDLEEFLERLAPENESWHTHTLEGPDDIVAHLRAAVTSTSLNVPVRNGALGLGTWQGIYLWEHRRRPHQRRVLLTVMG